MYIKHGPDINAALTKVIGISTDNADWNYIDKEGITKITRTFIPFIRSSVANRGYKHEQVAVVEIHLKDGTSVKFDVQDVENQLTWNDGTQAALNVAVTDLEIWRST